LRSLIRRIRKKLEEQKYENADPIERTSNVPNSGTLQAHQHTLHLNLSVREVETVRKIFASLATLPRVHVNIQLPVSMTRPQGIDGNLENSPGQRLPELESLQIGVDGAKATFHTFLHSPEC
jgi:hypothetical protein